MKYLVFFTCLIACVLGAGFFAAKLTQQSMELQKRIDAERALRDSASSELIKLKLEEQKRIDFHLKLGMKADYHSPGARAAFQLMQLSPEAVPQELAAVDRSTRKALDSIQVLEAIRHELRENLEHALLQADLTKRAYLPTDNQ